MPFTGRNLFFSAVKNKLKIVTPNPTPTGKGKEVMEDEKKGGDDNKIPVLDPIKLPFKSSQRKRSASVTPGDLKHSFSIVYSTVSGTGKTVSMLQLKEHLRGDSYFESTVIIVAYLGFNDLLQLTDGERRLIRNEKVEGARKVLARRLVASAIISHNNTEAITQLPTAEDVYDSYVIPSVETSKQLLIDYMSSNSIQSLTIIAGVDEVQLLNANQDLNCDGVGLGMFFLRTLRYWQVNWNIQNIHLLPIGTGIELDWSEDQTLGKNTTIKGDDAVLITKVDFKTLAHTIITGMDETTFQKRFGGNTSRETIIENVSAIYWPRVRLLEWLNDKNAINLIQSEWDNRSDANQNKWCTWLSMWMLDELIDIQKNPELLPGKGEGAKSIRALFELRGQNKIAVIPDGFNAPSILDSLSENIPMRNIYDQLKLRFETLEPHSLIPNDEYDFEFLGFDVVTTAIHMGLYTISTKLNQNQGPLTLKSATNVQKQRLGLALWFTDRCPSLFENSTLFRRPRVVVLGQGSTSDTTQLFPFNTGQTSFQDEVVQQFKEAAIEQKPLYIRGGKNTGFDYIHLFFTGQDSETNKYTCICMISDAKHTTKEPADSKITAIDQIGLYKAALKVNKAVERLGYIIQSVRLMFVTNRLGCVDTNISDFVAAKNEVDKIWPDNRGLELLNEETFDFGPFSDVLMARRHLQKRKSESTTAHSISEKKQRSDT